MAHIYVLQLVHKTFPCKTEKSDKINKRGTLYAKWLRNINSLILKDKIEYSLDEWTLGLAYDFRLFVAT